MNKVELVKAVIAHDVDATIELYGQVARLANKCANTHHIHRDRWEDIIGDTWLAVYQAVLAGRVTNPEAVSGYIWAVAHNVIVGHWRKPSVGGGVTVPDKAIPNDIEKGLIAKEESEWLDNAVATLSPKLAAVVQWERLGKNAREIARIMKMNQRTVKTRRNQAHHALRMVAHA
jgi:RNA polymerase sigma factor (sigma-70 family)